MNKIIPKLNFIVPIVFTVFTLPITAQTNYNPWQHMREELTISRLEKMQANDQYDCENVREQISDYEEAKKQAIGKDSTKISTYMALRSLSFYQCRETYDYLKDIVRTDPSEQVRCNVIRLLGWMRNTESIGFLRELLKKEKLTRAERYSILLACCHIGLFNKRQDILDEALSLIDKFCMDKAEMPQDCTDEDCAELYFTIGGESALNYFSYCLKNEETQLTAALKLAQLGEYETTYPIFAATLKNGNADDFFPAMQGLATIGTEEAFALIKVQTLNENPYIAQMAQWIFDYIDKKGGKL